MFLNCIDTCVCRFSTRYLNRLENHTYFSDFNSFRKPYFAVRFLRYETRLISFMVNNSTGVVADYFEWRRLPFK